MANVSSFPPVIGLNPRIIILGSMPGIASLEAVQYYAHPRNAFWPIMAELFGVQHYLDYDARIEQLRALPLILWDTLAACYRPGSLDSESAIDPADNIFWADRADWYDAGVASEKCEQDPEPFLKKPQQ